LEGSKVVYEKKDIADGQKQAEGPEKSLVDMAKEQAGR
jgi:hypothetical protein